MMPMYLVQDALEGAWAKTAMWQGVHDMRAWLFGVMYKLHGANVWQPTLHTGVLEGDTLEVPVASVPTERCAVLDLQAALQQLPVEQREIILPMALVDWKGAEVALKAGNSSNV